MSIFYHEEEEEEQEEETPNPSKRSKFLATCFMDAFSHCPARRRLKSLSSKTVECPASDDFDDEQEVIVSTIRSRAMEKLKRKPSGLNLTDSFTWVYSLEAGDLHIIQKGAHKKEEDQENEDGLGAEKEEFLSVASCFSCCSSSAAASREVFLSVKTSLSRCSSLNGFEFKDFDRRQSIIQQLCHCQGWPFGLCRRAVLLPPLPKSPSESWSWRKGNKFVKNDFTSKSPSPRPYLNTNSIAK